MKRVRFTIQAPGAKKVLLAGDFTNWERRARSMRRGRTSSRTFAAYINLHPGTYQYKFIVDGEWITDPKADAVMNSFGTHNSVVTVSG